MDNDVSRIFSEFRGRFLRMGKADSSMSTRITKNATDITALQGLTDPGDVILQAEIDALTAGTPSLPVAISQGGTGQVTAAAAFDALDPLTTSGDTLYENANPSAVRLAGNTTVIRKFLVQTGTGSASAAPAWDTREHVTTLTFSSTIAVNAALGDSYDITASSGTIFTLSNPTNVTNGQQIIFRIKEAGPIAAVPLFGTAYSGTSGVTLSTGTGLVDILVFSYVGLISKWCLTHAVYGFS